VRIVAYWRNRLSIESVKRLVRRKPIRCGTTSVGAPEVAMEMNWKQKVRVSITESNECYFCIVLTIVARCLCTPVPFFMFVSPFVRLFGGRRSIVERHAEVTSI
jgi:hypothetical protein